MKDERERGEKGGAGGGRGAPFMPMREDVCVCVCVHLCVRGGVNLFG